MSPGDAEAHRDVNQTEAGRIWLNLNLATKSLVRLEHMIVHELLHPREPTAHR